MSGASREAGACSWRAWAQGGSWPPPSPSACWAVARRRTPAEADPRSSNGRNRSSEHPDARAAQVRLERPFYVLPPLHDEDIRDGVVIVADGVSVQPDLTPLADQTGRQEEQGGRRPTRRSDAGALPVVQHVHDHVQIVVIGHVERDFALGDVVRDGLVDGLVSPVEHEAGWSGEQNKNERRFEPQHASTGREGHGAEPSAHEKGMEGSAASRHDNSLTTKLVTCATRRCELQPSSACNSTSCAAA